MPINISLLQAYYGDCIFLSYEGGNILIDGGTSQTYHDLHDKHNPDKALKKLVRQLQDDNQHIDLLVVSHVDDDHIGGIKEWFENNYPADGFISEIWMNDNIILKDGAGLQNSPKSAGSLLELWKKRGQRYRNDIVLGVEEDKGPFHIRVLSPLPKYRNTVANKIQSTLKNKGIDTSKYKMSLKELNSEQWGSNAISIENRASIALELSIPGEKILMLGDAHIDDITTGLDYFYPNKDEQIQYSVIKLSHHGSKNNFDPSFLKRVRTNDFLVSTNGDYFNHPDKEVIAQIICNSDACIGFNYQNRIDSLFTEQDYQDFPNLHERTFVTT